MENPMRMNEFHKSFIQSMVLVAFVTVFAMVSSRYIVDYYFNSKISPAKTLEYSSQQSNDSTFSSVVE